MQAIILAAGMGSRLSPLTDIIPKAMVEINGKPLLVNALDNLKQNGINDVIIVIGYKKEVIIAALGTSYNGMNITYIENPLFRTTNNVYSLYLAKNYVHDSVMLLECDLYYEQGLLARMLQGTAECNILVSPYNPLTMDGTVIDSVDGINARALILKRDQYPGFDYSNKYKTVNVYTFSADFIMNRFYPAIELYVETQGVSSYYELVLGSLIYYQNQQISIVTVSADEWCEIDDQRDLKRAEMHFSKALETNSRKLDAR